MRPICTADDPVEQPAHDIQQAVVAPGVGAPAGRGKELLQTLASDVVHADALLDHEPPDYEHVTSDSCRHQRSIWYSGSEVKSLEVKRLDFHECLFQTDR